MMWLVSGADGGHSRLSTIHTVKNFNSSAMKKCEVWQGSGHQLYDFQHSVSCASFTTDANNIHELGEITEPVSIERTSCKLI